MLTRSLGRTGLMVSRLGLGLAALGRPGYINLGHAADLHGEYDPEAMRRRTHQVLDAAWTAGVRYFDTARSYGRGEEFLAAWLVARGIAPAEVVVGSKWGYTYTANWRIDAEQHEVKDHTLPVLKRQWTESTGFLGPHLDVYQIHSATRESGVLNNRGILEELSRLREQGLKIGLSVSGPRQNETIRDALATGVFDCVQATWNLLEPSAGSALAEAHAAGLGVIVKEALANGRLTERNVEPAFQDRRRQLRRHAERLGVTLDALALAAAMNQPWADVVLSGAATVEQWRSNWAAAPIRFDANLNEFAESPDEYWAIRSRLAWN